MNRIIMIAIILSLSTGCQYPTSGKGVSSFAETTDMRIAEMLNNFERNKISSKDFD